MDASKHTRGRFWEGTRARGQEHTAKGEEQNPRFRVHAPRAGTRAGDSVQQRLAREGHSAARCDHRLRAARTYASARCAHTRARGAHIRERAARTDTWTCMRTRRAALNQAGLRNVLRALDL
eukprot:5988851-Pleurochrysis_carterae.AAC.2